MGLSINLKPLFPFNLPLKPFRSTPLPYPFLHVCSGRRPIGSPVSPGGFCLGTEVSRLSLFGRIVRERKLFLLAEIINKCSSLSGLWVSSSKLVFSSHPVDVCSSNLSFWGRFSPAREDFFSSGVIWLGATISRKQ